MRNLKTTAISLLLLLLAAPILAQPVSLFSEDFEGGTITSFLNAGETSLNADDAPCGMASVGTADDFNSTNVDFAGLVNSSYFMGVNPEVTCGGYYDATVNTATLDFTGGTDSIGFLCRYYKTSTLGWGSNAMTVTFSNGTDDAVYSSEFSVADQWTSFSTRLPDEMISNTVAISISIAGGEGVAIDDIQVLRYEPEATSTGLAVAGIKAIRTYPNPVTDVLQWNSGTPAREITLTTLQGQEMLRQRIDGQNQIDLSTLPNGMYILRLQGADGRTWLSRITKSN